MSAPARCRSGAWRLLLLLARRRANAARRLAPAFVSPQASPNGSLGGLLDAAASGSRRESAAWATKWSPARGCAVRDHEVAVRAAAAATVRRVAARSGSRGVVHRQDRAWRTARPSRKGRERRLRVASARVRWPGVRRSPPAVDALRRGPILGGAVVPAEQQPQPEHDQVGGADRANGQERRLEGDQHGGDPMTEAVIQTRSAVKTPSAVVIADLSPRSAPFLPTSKSLGLERQQGERTSMRTTTR